MPDSADAAKGVLEAGPTARFRRQHAELFEEALALGALLDAEKIRVDPQEVRRALSRFAGRLRVHARMEDEALYPRLLAHEDPALRGLAERFLSEVGGLYSSFDAFEQRWPDAATIGRNPADFVRDTGRVLRSLGKRMMAENGELYPAVDALEG